MFERVRYVYVESIDKDVADPAYSCTVKFRFYTATDLGNFVDNIRTVKERTYIPGPEEDRAE